MNRSNFNAVAVTAEAGQRTVGSGSNANWADITGGSIVDLTPAYQLARLDGTRTGAAYGWEAVFVSADGSGVITTEVAAYGDAQSGTPTALPAIDPNGNETLVDGGATPIVLLWPCAQGGTWQYMIVGFAGGSTGPGHSWCSGLLGSLGGLSWNSSIGGAPIATTPSMGNLGRLTVSNGQTIRGNAVIEYSISTPVTNLPNSPTGVIVLAQLKWVGAPPGLAFIYTVQRGAKLLDNQTIIQTMNLPIYATNTLGMSANLTCDVTVYATDQWGVTGGFVSSSTVYTLS
jgi:hypothetical protein